MSMHAMFVYLFSKPIKSDQSGTLWQTLSILFYMFVSVLMYSIKLKFSWLEQMTNQLHDFWNTPDTRLLSGVVEECILMIYKKVDF